KWGARLVAQPGAWTEETTASSQVRKRRLLRFRRQSAGFADQSQIQACRRKFGDAPTIRRVELDSEQLCADQFTRSSLVHGKEVAVDPVPGVLIVRIIGANAHPHLGLPPEAGPVRAREFKVGIEVGELQLAICA